MPTGRGGQRCEGVCPPVLDIQPPVMESRAIAGRRLPRARIDAMLVGGSRVSRERRLLLKRERLNDLMVESHAAGGAQPRVALSHTVREGDQDLGRCPRSGRRHRRLPRRPQRRPGRRLGAHGREGRRPPQRAGRRRHRPPLAGRVHQPLQHGLSPRSTPGP